jgi:hypothetical protein
MHKLMIIMLHQAIAIADGINRRCQQRQVDTHVCCQPASEALRVAILQASQTRGNIPLLNLMMMTLLNTVYYNLKFSPPKVHAPPTLLPAIEPQHSYRTDGLQLTDSVRHAQTKTINYPAVVQLK